MAGTAVAEVRGVAVRGVGGDRGQTKEVGVLYAALGVSTVVTRPQVHLEDGCNENHGENKYNAKVAKILSCSGLI